MVTRRDYQLQRLAFLKTYVDLETSEGLEIGACDLPTVPRDWEKCEFADFRSSDDLIRTFNLPPETVVPVKYILNRDIDLHLQINRKFDYIILCHVIEHVPNVISYLQSLRKLLKPKGVVFIACPDKRRTSDAPRPSTTLDHLLADYYHNTCYPPLDHILEGSKVWAGLAQLSMNDPRAFYDWACNNFESGLADAHCHVWFDEEFFSQIEYLTCGNIIGGLKSVGKGYNNPDYNEFFMVLQATSLEGFEDPKRQTPNPENERLQLQISRLSSELSKANNQIEAMESSKFWKLRKLWFRLKNQ
jgi:SAM-dependent methyltransferase